MVCTLMIFSALLLGRGAVLRVGSSMMKCKPRPSDKTGRYVLGRRRSNTRGKACRAGMARRVERRGRAHLRLLPPLFFSPISASWLDRGPAVSWRGEGGGGGGLGFCRRHAGRRG